MPAQLLASNNDSASAVGRKPKLRSIKKLYFELTKNLLISFQWTLSHCSEIGQQSAVVIFCFSVLTPINSAEQWRRFVLSFHGETCCVQARKWMNFLLALWVDLLWLSVKLCVCRNNSVAPTKSFHHGAAEFVFSVIYFELSLF